MFRYLVCTAALAGLAACGGSGGTADIVMEEDDERPVTIIIEDESLFSQYNRFLDNSDADILRDVSTFGESDLRATGIATYDGVMAIQRTGDPATTSSEIANNPDYLGDMRVSIALRDDTFSGDVTNFVNANGNLVSGRMTFTNGELQRPTGSNTSAGIGVVTAGNVEDIALTGGLLGYFEDRDTLVGRVADGTDGTDGTYQGMFVVED